MKTMSKVTAFILSLAISVVAFTACNTSYGNDPDPNTTTAAEADVTTASNKWNDGTSRSNDETTVTAESTTEATKAKKSADIADIADKILNFPQATAGSTLKSVEIAAELINFSRDNKQPITVLETVTGRFLDNLTDAEKEQFTSNLYEIDYVARALIKGDTESFKSYIDDVSVDYEKGSYSMAKYEEIYKVLADV